VPSDKNTIPIRTSNHTAVLMPVHIQNNTHLCQYLPSLLGYPLLKKLFISK